MYDPNAFHGESMPSRNPNLLHPYVLSLYQNHLKLCAANPKLAPYEVKAVATLRTTAYQNALYAQGRTTPGKIVTKARGGTSMHEFGLAYDIGIFKTGVYIEGANAAENELYFEAARIGKSLGLFWGGDWITIKDYPHFEYLAAHKDADALALLNGGKSVDEVIGSLA